MPAPARWIALLALAATCVAASPLAGAAATRHATPGRAAVTLAAAAEGDTVVLGAGIHAGPLTVARRLVLRGAPGAVLDGGGRGSVLEVDAAGAVVEDLEVRGSGARVITIDSGVRVRGSDVVLRRLRVLDVTYGITIERAERVTVEDCRLVGRAEPLTERGDGNGLHLWYAPEARLTRCDVSRFLDAVYLSFADRVRVEGTRLHHNGRYGLHTMYCHEIALERSRFERNVAGCAVMFTVGMVARDNDFVDNRGPRTYGLLLKDGSACTFEDNRMVGNTIAMFLDNSNRNRFAGNLVQDNGWGILLFSSCKNNVFTGNTFLNNDYPVALDMRRTVNAFDDGTRGNYWSDAGAYDLDGDAIGDAPFHPVSTFAFLSRQFPDLTVLSKSPAVAALGVAERVFPALRASEAVDERPLVAPPHARARANPVARAGPAPLAMAVSAALLGLGLAALAGGRGVRRSG